MCVSIVFELETLRTGMCADLPSILNGAIAYNDNTMHQKPVNTVATYSCNAGHTLYNGSTTRTCQDSVWTGSSPTCKGNNYTEITNGS